MKQASKTYIPEKGEGFAILKKAFEKTTQRSKTSLHIFHPYTPKKK